MQLKLDQLNAITEFHGHLITQYFIDYRSSSFMFLHLSCCFPPYCPKKIFTVKMNIFEKEILKITNLFQYCQVTYFRKFFTFNLELDLNIA